MKFPVFDLHCDTALALLGKDFAQIDSLARNQHHIDLERAAALDGYAQCFACFTTQTDKLPGGISVSTWFEREMIAVLNQVEANSKRIRLAYTADDVRKNYAKGIMSAILTIEGSAGIGYDKDLLPDLYNIGFRMVSLGWNEKNILCGSHVTGGGLTAEGAAFVKEAQKCGYIVDVSHISDEAFWDVIDIAQKPVIASHSNSRAICEHSRNLTDDMFRAICSVGGVAGFNQCADFVGENPTLDTVCDHLLHFLEIDPDGCHIALGGDLDGCDKLPDGFCGIDSYNALAERMLQRGIGEDMIRRIYWDNALEVLEKCCI